MVSVLACVTWVVCLHEWHSWRAIISGMLLLLLLLFLKQYPEAKNVEYLLLKQESKNFSNRFGQGFKRRALLEEQVLVYTI